jgi:hypothetical protein
MAVFKSFRSFLNVQKLTMDSVDWQSKLPADPVHLKLKGHISVVNAMILLIFLSIILAKYCRFLLEITGIFAEKGDHIKVPVNMTTVTTKT